MRALADCGARRRRGHRAPTGGPRAALEADAEFLIAPNLSPEVAAVARESGAMYCPGAYTTTGSSPRTAGAARREGVPVGVAGGPDYIRVIRDPLPRIPHARSRRHLGNLAAFLDAGLRGHQARRVARRPALASAGRFDGSSRARVRRRQ